MMTFIPIRAFLTFLFFRLIFKELAEQKDQILKLSFNDLQKALCDGKLSAKMVLRAYQLKVKIGIQKFFFPIISSDRSFGCPIIYYAILFTETSTMPDTTKPIP